MSVLSLECSFSDEVKTTNLFFPDLDQLFLNQSTNASSILRLSLILMSTLFQGKQRYTTLLYWNIRPKRSSRVDGLDHFNYDLDEKAAVSRSPATHEYISEYK